MSTAPTTAPLVSLQGVSVVFGGRVRALDDVTLAIDRGDIVGLVGESGSGKTTLCRVLVGLTPPTAGSVSVGGEAAAAAVDGAVAVSAGPVPTAPAALGAADPPRALCARQYEVVHRRRFEELIR